MKKLIWVAALLVGVRAWCPPGGPITPPSGLANQCPSNVVESANCSGYERQWCIDYTNSIIFACNPTTHIWNSVGSAGGGGGGAPVGATYITKTTNSTLTGEFALASLGTGILKNTTGTGNLSIAVSADLPAAASVILSSDPAACPANQWVNDLSTTLALGCAQIGFSNLSGTALETQIPAQIARDSEVSAGYQPLDADLTTISALDQGVGGCADGKIMKVSGGVWTCQDDSVTTNGTGITTLNGLTADPQSFADVDDSNVTLAISSATSTHTFTMGWNGDLPFSRLAQGAALSVLGVGANATADVASIGAGTDGQVLRRSGNTLAFGQVDLANTNAVTGTLPVSNLPTAIPDANISDTLTASIFKGSGTTTDAVDLATTEVAGTLAAARMPALTGDVVNTVGTLATVIQDNAVDGGDISLASETTGSIMYQNGADWAVLNPTTNGFVLTLSGGLPAWSLPAGGGTVTISGTPAATQLTGWNSSTAVQGVSGTSFDSLGNLTATSFTSVADTVLGGCLTLNEGTSFGFNAVSLCVPDSTNLTASPRYDTDASGKFQASMIQVGTGATTPDAGTTLTLHDFLVGSPTSGQVPSWNGTNWVPGTGGGGSTSPLTTKGDLWGFSSVDARVPAGTDGYILTADSTQTLGVKYSPALSATITSEAQGDILYRNSSGWVNLPAGTAGTVLSTGGAGANPSWIAASGTGTVTSIATTAPISGGTITTTGTLSISANGINNTLIRQGGAQSVIGVAGNATANVADISASTDGYILRRLGTTLGFGSIDLSDNDAVGASVLPGANGGTGNAFMSFAGPASTVKTFTLPNSTATIMTAANTGTSSANVLHGSASGVQTWGAVALATDVSGNLPIENLAGGANADSTHYWRGDGTWATPAGSGTVTASGGALTSNSVVLGAGTTDTKVVAGIITDGTSKLTLGVAGSSVGSVDFKNATSGTLTLSPVTGALGTVTLSLPAATDRLVGRDTTDTMTNKTLTSPTLTTPVLGVATATSINKVAITAPATSATLTIVDGKTLTANKSLTLDGTDSTTMTFPTTTATIARTDAAQTFTGTNTFVSATSLLLGSAGSAVGDVGFRNGTSGTITLAPPTGALGTVTLTLPAAADTLVGKATTDTLTNKTLDVEGTGNSVTIVDKVWLQAAGCNNATAAPMWDLPTSLAPTPTCVAGTNTFKAYLDFPDSDGAYQAQTQLALPSDWAGAIDVKIKWLSSITTGNAFWQVSTICVADAETDDPAFNTASTVADAAKGTTNQLNDATITGLTTTGCAAGELMHLKIMRDRTNGSDTLGAAAARLVGVELTLRRAQ